MWADAGLLALVAAAQLAVLQGSFAALQCREQLASAERLMTPALAIFYYLSQVREIYHISPSLWLLAQTAIESVLPCYILLPLVCHFYSVQDILYVFFLPGMAVPSLPFAAASAQSQSPLPAYLSFTWAMFAVAHDQGGGPDTPGRQDYSSGGLAAQAAVHVAIPAGVPSVLSGCIGGKIFTEQPAWPCRHLNRTGAS